MDGLRKDGDAEKVASVAMEMVVGMLIGRDGLRSGGEDDDPKQMPKLIFFRSWAWTPKQATVRSWWLP